MPTPSNPKPFWQRLYDRLAGPPNVEKLEKLRGRNWFIRHQASMAMLLASIPFLVAPGVVSRLNGIPDFATLHTVSVRIIRTHETEPHLFVELPDGSQRGMEWPVRITGGQGGFRFYGWSEEERKRLPGCRATVRGLPLRWILEDRFRIWELDCPEHNIRIGWEKTLRAQGIKQSESYLPFFLLFGYAFAALIFIREQRGNI